MADSEKKSPSTPKKNKAEKADKGSNTKKQGRLKRWTREMKSELMKVQWPSKKQTAKHTTTVLCCVGLIGLFIWVYDFLASNVVNALIDLI